MSETKTTTHVTNVHQEFLALLERGRQIKARRQKEAEEWISERRRRQQEAEKTGLFNLGWV